MSRKKWLLLILIVLLLAGWWKLFYKTWNNQTVPAAADCIVAADVKRITNTLIWDFITTPSRWKEQNIFSSSHKDEVSWEDMIKLPDYVFVFHLKNQSSGYWHCMLPIRNQEDFAKGIQQYHFENKGDHHYFLPGKNLSLKIISQQVLISILPQYDKAAVDEAANQLAGTVIPEQALKRNVELSAHISLQYFSDNDFQLASLNFNQDEINISTWWNNPQSFLKATPVMNTFHYNSQSLCTIAFTQHPFITHYLSDSAKARINAVLNFSADSLLQPDNFNYQFDLQTFTNRIDTAITYTYDDNFNPVEKKAINTLEEPSYQFMMRGKGTLRTFDYWKRNNLLEEKPEGYLFTAVPFVKSYCNIPAADTCSIRSVNYNVTAADKTKEAVFFMRLLVSKIPPSLLRYLPDAVQKSISNIEWIELEATRNKKTVEVVEVKAVIRKKKNLRPIIEW